MPLTGVALALLVLLSGHRSPAEQALAMIYLLLWVISRSQEAEPAPVEAATVLQHHTSRQLILRRARRQISRRARDTNAPQTPAGGAPQRPGVDHSGAVDELHHALRRARDAAERRARFVATVSHDLRTPLTSILGYIDLLRLGAFGALTDEQRAVLAHLDTSARHLHHLIEDMLTFAVHARADVVLERQPCALGPLVTEVSAALAPSSSSAAAPLVVSIDPALPSTLRVNRAALQQVLGQLLDNAMKFTAAGGVTLNAARSQLPDGPAVLFEVIDTGIGMSAEECELLFEPFSKADSSNTRPRDGLGLGLAICHQLVTHMGGTIQVSSQLGIGTTVQVRIPLDSEADTAAAHRESAPWTERSS